MRGSLAARPFVADEEIRPLRWSILDATFPEPVAIASPLRLKSAASAARQCGQYRPARIPAVATWLQGLEQWNAFG